MIQPDVRPITSSDYLLNEDYTYEWEHEGSHKITVPKGFETDLASVPRFVWTLTGIRPDGLLRAGALVHDFIYRNKGRLPMGSHLKDGISVVKPWTRNQADKMFARIMREAGVSKFKRRAAYMAVRVFGWMAWK